MNFDNTINDILSSYPTFNLSNNNIFEVMSGFDTSVPAKYLESTLVEAGLGMVVVHNKYDYCHGRTTLSHQNKGHTLIYLKSNNSGLDDLIIQETKTLYDNVILLESKFNDDLISNFDLLVQSMYLTKSIAEEQQKDLSRVEYAPAVKQLYYFKGKM